MWRLTGIPTQLSTASRQSCPAAESAGIRWVSNAIMTQKKCCQDQDERTQTWFMLKGPLPFFCCCEDRIQNCCAPAYGGRGARICGASAIPEVVPLAQSRPPTAPGQRAAAWDPAPHKNIQITPLSWMGSQGLTDQIVSQLHTCQ